MREAKALWVLHFHPLLEQLTVICPYCLIQNHGLHRITLDLLTFFLFQVIGF